VARERRVAIRKGHQSENTTPTVFQEFMTRTVSQYLGFAPEAKAVCVDSKRQVDGDEADSSCQW
jgi:hypothetical protein